MDDFELVIKNYRCFTEQHPARLRVGSGFTALVGANNSGKSSLLRFFGEFRNLWQYFDRPPDQILRLLNTGFAQFPLTWVSDPLEVFTKQCERPIEIEIKTSGNGINGVRFTVNRPLPPSPPQLSAVPAVLLDGEPIERGRLQSIGPRIRQSGTTNNMPEELIELLRAFHSAMFIGPFRNALELAGGNNHFDLEVGQAFIGKWKSLKTGPSIAENELAFRITQEIKHIFGFSSLEINAADNNQTLKIAIEGRSYRLGELGSGLAEFAVIIAQTAIRKPSIILIDEPELHLHPSLQIDFLTTLGSYAAQGVVVFATHNIGLARSCAERIYSFRRERTTEMNVLEATPRLGELLGELSYSGYQALGYTKVLLVEGKTEIKTVQQFLRKLQLDHRIVLLSLGGSSSINSSSAAELTEVKRICTSVLALVDSERTWADGPLSSERQDFVDMCEDIGIKCHVLRLRAIENYFSERAIREVKGSDKYTALLPFQTLKQAAVPWAKSENWRIARAMHESELEGTDLWDFLKSLKE